jgi:hypothetical protein
VTETASQFSTAAAAPITTKGEIQFRDKDDIATSRLLRLQPGHRYLLSFDFLTPPIEGYLYAVGPWIHRTYSLPDAGGPKAFGMRTGESRSLTLWTDQASPEEIQLKIAVADRTHIVHGARLATFTLRDIDQSKLLVRIDSSFPLHFRVTAPGFGYAVETPRRFIPGYAATVNGAPGRVLRSPTGAVMVALPAGECEVSLNYAGPPAARAAFWVCAASWLVLALVGATGLLDKLDPAGTAIQAVRTAGRFVSSHWLAAALLILLAGAIGFLEARSLRRRQLLDSAGPIEVTFELPYALVPQNLPLVVTGHVGEGVMVFVRLVDATHISLGADVWGQLFQTQPIEVDYSQPHRLVVSDSALLPPDNPQVQRMSKKERDYFGRTLLLELDGRQEMAQVCNTFAATPDEIYIGQAPFGSDTEPRFIGKILRVARLPIPRRAVLPSTLVATLTVRRAGESPQEREPLLSILKGPNSRVLTVRYLSAQRVRLSLYDAEGTELQGSEVGFGSDRSHALQVSYRMPQLGGADTLDVVLDGAPILAQADGSPWEQVPILISGLNQTGISGIASRFTGSELAMTTTLKEHLPPTIASPSTANLIVLFPSDRPGRHEPLLTTGKTGAGDVVYVAYLDALHVQFGFDHWNGPGASSPPVLIDYKVPHEIRISMASLNPGGQTKPDPGVSLSIDGHEMINSATTHSYPAEPAQITFGQNRIGASTADPDFSGTILFLSRGGTEPADRLVEPEPGDAR